MNLNLNRPDINIWLKNVDNYYSSYKVSNKGVIGNPAVNGEFLYIRRLFVDWIHSNKSFADLKKFQSFKSVFSKYLKSLPQDSLNHNFIIWKDLQIFLKNHGQFLRDVYHDCISEKPLFRVYVLLKFSTVCVNLFYKWRQKRNDSMRGWFSYDNRRKRPSNINMAYFSNIMLKEAEYTRYRSFLKDNSDYVRVY